MQILDTTLRDGSYVINFQFSAADTAVIAAELDAAGIDLIEVGHGVGLGASEHGHGSARESDVAYMRAAASAVKKAKWGMFCIPGIAQLDDLKTSVDEGMDFIRIGVPINEVEEAEAFVSYAKQAGLYVAANFMKSYACRPEEFGAAAARAEGYGADVVYVVDSAGNMTPEDVEAFVAATRRVTNVPLGFHAHNNLGLANANSLHALALGCNLIDTSLQGMGRCTGNAITEQFVALLIKKAISQDYDLFRLMDAAELFVRPLLTQIGHDSVDLACGFAGFHSSYMGAIREAALLHDVDPRRLIMQICEVTKLSAPKELVEQEARKIAAQSDHLSYKHRFPLRQYFGHEQDP